MSNPTRVTPSDNSVTIFPFKPPGYYMHVAAVPNQHSTNNNTHL
jgi:hypothetical protein